MPCFIFIWKVCDQPKSVKNMCAHSLLDIVLANNASQYKLHDNLLHLNQQLFVLNHHAKDECNTVQTCYVVCQIIFDVSLGEIHHLFT